MHIYFTAHASSMGSMLDVKTHASDMSNSVSAQIISST